MPIDNRVDQSKQSQGTLGTAPYLAKIVNHLDPTFQGGVEVSLIRPSGNQIADENQTYNVKYSSPFYGSTAFEFTGNNVTYNDAQKSYGFWGVPPDIGVTGIVIFIDGQPDKGFWLCCVQDIFQNHMIPAIGGTKNYQTDQDYEQGEHPLPVAEHNRRANEMSRGLEIDKIPRAVHPFANRIKEQGLIRDEFRGTSSSTVRRDLPNLVFGMSSPGPLDRAGKKSFVGNRQSLSGSPVPVSRLGGTQFVMDDGDDRYFRSKKATDGPPEYIKDGGNFDLPYNEHFRIRTRTGHQILLHNTEDLIYIGNARGTAWIEITSDGKIDIFSADSISVRTKQDFNFRCDRDFNLEVGRNFTTKVHGEMYTNVVKDNVLVIDKDQKIHVKGRKDETIDEQYRQTVNDDVKKYYAKDFTHNIDGRFDLRVAKGMSFSMGAGASGPSFAPFAPSSNDPNNPCSNDDAATSPVQDVNGPTPDRLDIKIYKDARIEHIGVNVDHTIRGYLKTKITGDVDISTDGTWEQTTQGNVDIHTPSNYRLYSGADMDVKAGGHVFTTSGGPNETLAGGDIIETAPNIHMNGPGASTASTADTAEIAVLPEEARISAKGTIPSPLRTHKLPDLIKPSAVDKPVDLDTILRRVPTFEPWPHHENLDPEKFKPKNLDRDVSNRYKEQSEDLKTPPTDWKKYKKPGDNPF